jgi:hypothetical protein
MCFSKTGSISTTSCSIPDTRLWRKPRNIVQQKLQYPALNDPRRSIHQKPSKTVTKYYYFINKHKKNIYRANLHKQKSHIKMYRQPFVVNMMIKRMKYWYLVGVSCCIHTLCYIRSNEKETSRCAGKRFRILSDKLNA